MANHKSSEKRIRQTATRRLRNRYYAKTARNAVRRTLCAVCVRWILTRLPLLRLTTR